MATIQQQVFRNFFLLAPFSVYQVYGLVVVSVQQQTWLNKLNVLFRSSQEQTLTLGKLVLPKKSQERVVQDGTNKLVWVLKHQKKLLKELILIRSVRLPGTFQLEAGYCQAQLSLQK
eukprot:TRINITY_DN3704_c0_g1_i1.p2 TRINITY_DN3704_c0_g1~~TRINITY_DN3704_c0_g1_i1.p2  ORF type:complete len:117 (+),score=6.92 TRINITY_DN3704_c0_g1_i1:1-351(+)